MEKELSLLLFLVLSLYNMNKADKQYNKSCSYSSGILYNFLFRELWNFE